MYYKVGISGHRDLLSMQKKENLSILKGHLLKLQREHPAYELLILSPLADGADRLIVEAALELGIKYDVILPMPKALYMRDFSLESKEEFIYYLEHAKSVQTIDLYAGNTSQLVQKDLTFRNFQYRQVGRKIVEMSDEMIIMSDGIPNDKMGGTEDIANYAKSCGKIIYTIRCKRQNAL